jgi:CRISPR-associated protein Cas5d
MKVERVSYDVMTPSAARGILEAIYWKPQIRWRVDRIRVLKPIRLMSLRRNEVGAKCSAANARSAMRTGRGSLGLFVEENRQQRAATILCDVDYLVEAHFDLLGGSDPAAKHREMFQRRAGKGQCFHRPYLGCREFDANFVWFEGDPPASEIEGERDLGYMLHDIDFENDMVPHFFRAVMRDGVIDVPALPTTEAEP